MTTSFASLDEDDRCGRAAASRTILGLCLLMLLVPVLGWSLPPAAPSVAWEKQISGSGSQVGQQVWQTSDCGFIVVGSAPDDSGTFGNMILVKTDQAGKVAWTKLYGTSSEGRSVRQTSDGGYVAVGADSDSLYVVKTDASGTKLWDKSFQYQNHQSIGCSVQQARDGGYIVAGKTLVNDIDIQQIYVLKLAANGDLAWEQTYPKTEDACVVWQTEDGGYIVGGIYETEHNEKPQLLKLDAAGNQQWAKIYEGEGLWDNFAGDGAGTQQTRDGGYVYAGTRSGSVYLLKTDAKGLQRWAKSYFPTGANSVQQTWDGGYILAGQTKDEEGKAAIAILRTDAAGAQLWKKTLPGLKRAEAFSIIQIGTGAYVLTGWTKASDEGPSSIESIELAQLEKDMTPVPDAALVADTIPATCDAGKTYAVSVTYENTGTMPWTFQDKTMFGPVAGTDAVKVFGAVDGKTVKVVNGAPNPAVATSATTH